MSETLPLPTGLVDRLRQIPTHAVLQETSFAALESKTIGTAEFKKLVSYILEYADGRDRREPWTNRPGVARPVPKLRLAVEACFGVYGDLQWFKLNKTANQAKKPLTGMFPRMAAALARIDPIDFGTIVEALLSPAPDASLLRFLHKGGGKVHGIGVEAFSRLCYVFRPDLYFTIPRPWGDTSGCLKFIGTDLRKYCALCRNLRTVCDDLNIPSDVRASVVQNLLEAPMPPAALLEALHKALGPSIAKYAALDPTAGHEPADPDTDDAALLPVEFAGRMIRGRRGHKAVRDKLIRAYGTRCALTGNCLHDLLEVAFMLPYATEEGPTIENSVPMRTDVHTLWDLNLIGIEASTRKVYVAPRLSGTIYEKLAGRALLPRTDGRTLKTEVLKDRWEMFVNAHQKDDERRSAGTRRARPAPAPAPRVEVDADIEADTDPGASGSRLGMILESESSS